MSDSRFPTSERGAALLTVLLLVAIIAVVTAVILERLTLSTRLAANSSALDQARADAMGAEQVAAVRIADLRAADTTRTTLQGDWHGTPQAMAVAGGQLVARVRDGGNCFNLNSLVTGNEQSGYAARPIAIAQLAGLMQVLGVDSGQAQAVAAAAADWIDSDDVPQPGGGAEDATYLAAPVPYRTANRLMIDPSEMRVVAGMTPDLYRQLRPWLCALPVTELSPLNVNTLQPDQGPLVAMLMPGRLSVEQARAMLASRPAAGYGNSNEFWAGPALRGITPDAEAMAQTKVSTRWFRVDIDVDLGGLNVHEVALMDADEQPARLVRRQWGDGA